ncbi:DNA topoisomerase IV subunit B [Micavibrio aeruginosavorus]|uniref:DNA topoisomerase IV subunit B n=1 Tax=Micavibrio aeruginosavorus TaxID=349221 RepID=UPI003F4AD803
MADLFANQMKKPSNSAKDTSYGASDIEVLEGLEPVRRRPGMYIGGTDERALHHLVVEILDNSMDEAVAGHADKITLTLRTDGSVEISDNGRGIPVDEHPKYPGKSALEVIMTTLHSGGKFSGKNYETSGGLHGVGSSVVNALSEWMVIDVARDKTLYRQTFARGLPTAKLKKIGPASHRGTTVSFLPDHEIFGKSAKLHPSMLYQIARSKAYLYRGVEILWECDPACLPEGSKTPAKATFHFPNGLLDFLTASLHGRPTITPMAFAGQAKLPDDAGRVEFAVAWPDDGEGFSHTYCNTVPTPLGGTHESGLRTALARGLRSYGDMVGNKKAGIITADDVMGGAAILLSVFIRDPQFQGQTKEKLVTAEATRWVDSAIKDHFDHWLSGDPASAKLLLDTLIERAEERQRRKDDKDMARKSATRKLRLPGKLSDCSRTNAIDTELFLVEGDSAGGSAKQARRRDTQAVLPLRGKILNVVSATKDKMRANQEIQDLILAMGTGTGKDCKIDNLRYERIIIMTDADVDGAHIASLLVTFFYTQMRPLIEKGHLYLAQPPLYRLSAGTMSAYARDDAHKEELMATQFKNRKVDISRFKGLGEMPAAQLKETTMDPDKRTLIRVTIPDSRATLGLTAETMDDDAGPTIAASADIDDLVERLMGRNAEARFNFIQDNAEFVRDLDI